MSNTMVRARAAASPRIDVAVLEVDRRAHRLEALDVLVDRPQADRAAAGQRNARLAGAREQRSQREDRRAHRLHQLVRRERPVDRARRRASPRPASRVSSATPICASSVCIVSHVVQAAAHWSACSGSDDSSAAHRSGNAAFLAPDTRTSPVERRARLRSPAYPCRLCALPTVTGVSVVHRQRVDLLAHPIAERRVDRAGGA